MTTKERLINALRGQDVDRIPWSPFLAYYWNHLPEGIQALGQVSYLKKMGADPLLRGFIQPYKVICNQCNIKTLVSGYSKEIRYETKVGCLVGKYTYSPEAHSWFLTDHPVKNAEDFKVLQYIAEHQKVKENIEEVESKIRELGEDGLYLPLLGTNLKTSFQSLVEHWCGTVDLVYALYDFPEVVEECLAVMRKRDMETVQAAVKTSAEGFIFWEDSSTTNISPEMFKKYTAPIINEWGQLLHQHDKLLVHHACGHLKNLIPLMAETEVDVIESMSPPPTGNIDVLEAADLLPSHIGIIGGIEPTFFQNCSMDELEVRVESLLKGMKGKRFILANSDSCPPKVEYEKFVRVSELVRASR